MDEQVLRLFVSSPGDVANERRRVDLVVERLNAEFQGRARIEAIRWETSYYSAHDTFQGQIPEAAECDVVVAIFRARLGSPLPTGFQSLPSGEPYPSGTAYEVLSAIEVRKAGKRVPDVYVFRHPDAPQITLDTPERAEIEAQWERLKQFFERWFRTSGGEFVAAFQDYRSTDDFAAKVEDCLRQWLEKRGFGAADRTWDRILRGTPFPGLPAFGEAHAQVFFGRDLAISQSIARLREAGSAAGRSAFLLVIGASGSGKSSLLRAGLLPRLVLPGTIPDIDLWRSAIMLPGQNPFLSLADSLFADGALGADLRGGTFRTREMLAKQLAADPDIALAPIRDALNAAAERRRGETQFDTTRPARIALAIDQGERLFSETDPGLVDAFTRLLAALVRQNLAYVIFVLRSDAYAHFQRSDALVSLRETGATFDLLPPTLAELEEIVTRPPALCHPLLEFEGNGAISLATQLVRDAKGGDALPLLQMTLARLYTAESARGDGMLRFADYRGMDVAVTETANEALGSVDAGARAQLPALVTRLVADIAYDPISGAAVPIVAPLDRGEFEAREPARHALVEAFVARRLLAAEGDGGQQRVRPVHEALLRIWPEAVAIVTEAGNLIRVRHTLGPIVDGWLAAPDAEKPTHLDISPALLGGAEALVARFGTDLPSPMRAFIAASMAAAGARAARERDEQERRVRDAERLAAANRRIAQIAGAGVVLASLLAAVAAWYWHDAQDQRTIAVAQQIFAVEQRDRAETALTIAVGAANTLVNDLGRKYQNSLGVSKTTIKDILQQALTLQEKLTSAGEVSDALKMSQIDALVATSETLLSLGDVNGALEAGERAGAIVAALSASKPDDIALKRSSAQAQERIGAADLALGRLLEAQAAYFSATNILSPLMKADQQNHVLLLEYVMAVDGAGHIAVAKEQYTTALDVFQKGLTLLQILQTATPGDVVLERDMAMIYSDIGRSRQSLSQFAAAEEAFKAGLDLSVTIAKAQTGDIQAQLELGRAQFRLGELQLFRGHYADALKTFEDGSLPVFTQLANADPRDLDIQDDLGAVYARIGNALVYLNRKDDARTRYGQAFDIAKRLVAATPANTSWQHALSTAYGNIGDELLSDGNAAEALTNFQAGLVIADALLDSSPNNEQWGIDRGLMLSRLGNALAALSRFDEAEKADRDSLEVRQSLAATTNSRHVAKTYDLLLIQTQLGNLLASRHRPADALVVYLQAVDTCAGIVKAAHDSDIWRYQLKAALNNVGTTQMALEKFDDALISFQQSLSISIDLSKTDVSNTIGKLDVPIAYENVGDAQLRLAHYADALAAYTSSQEQLQALVTATPTDLNALRSLAVADNKIGTVFLAQGKSADALPAYKLALDIAEHLLKSAPDNQIARADVQFTFWRFGLVGSAMLRSRDFAGALGVADLILDHADAPLWAHLLRANALMFLGRADEAKAEHDQHRGTRPFGDKVWEDVVAANFTELKGLGLSDPLMDEIVASFNTPK